MSDDVVRFVAVGKTYQLGATSVQALSGIQLSVTKGEFLAVVGPSGSGKTTLLNLAGCLDVPTSGEVYVQGHPVSHLDDRHATSLRRDAIGFIFQSFNLIPVLSVYENVEFPLVLQKRPRAERAARVSDIIHSVGLENFQANRPDQLSGGQRQRVAIARALATHPVIVLADEPTANLDSETGRSIVRLMQQINRERQVTFIFSTHDPSIMQLATRKVVLQDGSIETDVQQCEEGTVAPRVGAC
jgi:putative ABC transport system ATP-binding protein